MRVDLHCHSSVSDGELPPEALYRLAATAQLDLMALTDHDTMDGFLALRDLQRRGELGDGPCLVSGVELTCAWEGLEIHVLGLGANPDDPGLRALLLGQRQRREQRAEQILSSLQRAGAHKLETPWRRLLGTSIPGRRHFARALVEAGHARDTGRAFRQWLRRLRPQPRTDWPDVLALAAIIHAADGTLVLAHPLAYRLTARRCRQLIADFRAGGGEAIEIAVPGYDAGQIDMLAREAVALGLWGSAGSDFHGPNQWRQLGTVPAMPSKVPALWTVRSLA